MAGSLTRQVENIELSRQFVARTIPTWYGAGAATIFTVNGGLVVINAIFVYHDTVIAGAVTITTVLGAVANSGDAGALTMAGAAGTITVLPLGNVAMVAPSAANLWPSILAATAFMFNRVMGPVAGLNTIVTTVGGAAMAAAERVSFRCIYRKIDTEAFIS